VRLHALALFSALVVIEAQESDLDSGVSSSP
jgi:hypothetical protein